jgi:polyisoprenoid-binding protein YceI
MAALLLFGTVSALAPTQVWKIGDKYSIKFNTSGVSGIFKGFSGTISFDEKDVASTNFNVKIDVASLNTGNALQNKHAKGDEWFDATKYPQMTFVSHKTVKTASGYEVTGDLTVRGIKKETKMPFTFKGNGASGIFSGSFNINRSDFHIGTPGGEVGEVIKVEVTMPVTKG